MIVAIRLRGQVHSCVRLLCFRRKVESIQECVKHSYAYESKQLTFLTISQSPQDDESSCQTERSSTLTCSSIVFQEKGGGHPGVCEAC